MIIFADEMRTDFYIAKRLYSKDSRVKNQESGQHADTSMSPAVRVALWGMIIGVLVMIITIFIVVGFKQTIREKVVGFGAHIQVVNFDNNNTYEMQPICINDTLLNKIRSVEGVLSATPFTTKPGMIKTQDAFQAIIFKGIRSQEPRAKRQESRVKMRPQTFSPVTSSLGRCHKSATR